MQHTPASGEALRQARTQFIQKGSCGSTIRPVVLNAWMRCKKYGISPHVKSVAPISHAKLSALLADNEEFVSISEPILQHLYQFLQGLGFVVALSDAHGFLLCIIGDENILTYTNQTMFVGADWSEHLVGNNAVGTPLVEDKPLQFWGYEHYTKLPQRWAGSGCPIHRSDGALLGGVSISGPCELSHFHTLGMAVMTARSIEMQIKLKEALDYTKLINQHQETIINSISEGILIADADGKVSLANDFILKYAKTSKQDLCGCKLSDFLSDRNLLRAIRAGEPVTDYITTLTFHGAPHSCTITCRKIQQNTHSPETLIVVGELIRAKALAQRINADEAFLTFNDIIGEDVQLRSMVRFAMVAAETSANVLILGESGTGKEVFAQAIHSGSLRKNGPFIAVNCGAIPKELIASTLFGYEEGAFTGAKKGGNPGKFELANNGTLFLDEIGELPLDVQTVLLRVLDQKSFTRVGGKKEITTNVRIIAATNRDLLQESIAMHFRQDLYYRLNVLSLQLPPLRERNEDVILLAHHFLRQMEQRYHRSSMRLSADAQALLKQYLWPGNIRELQNTIERAVVLSEGDEITAQSLQNLLPTIHQLPAAYTAPVQPPQQGAAKEREQLLRVLEECRWNISKAAVQLNIARSTLYRKMYYYDLKK